MRKASLLIVIIYDLTSSPWKKKPVHSVQFPFSIPTQTSKWKSSPSAIFLSYSNEWIWCYCQGSECKIYKLFRHFLRVCYFCSWSSLIRWTLDKMSRRKAKLMRKSFGELGWGLRPWLGSCIRAVAHAWTRLLSWDGLARLPWPPLAWPQLAPVQHSCSSPLARTLGGWTWVQLQLPKPCPCPASWPAAPGELKSDHPIWDSVYITAFQRETFLMKVFLPIPPQNLSYYNIILVVWLDQKLSLESLQVLFDKKTHLLMLHSSFRSWVESKQLATQAQLTGPRISEVLFIQLIGSTAFWKALARVRYYSSIHFRD